MRTILIILVGSVLAVGFAGAGRLLARGGRPGGTAVFGVFIVVWTAVAAANMWAGVARAGYSVLEELPIFGVVVAVPLAVGFAVQRTMDQRATE